MIAFKTNYTFLYRIMKPTFDKFTIIYNSTVIQLNIIYSPGVSGTATWRMSGEDGNNP